jgi:predicted flap endonuclease-1-like 5' DNA nuclease
MPAFTTNQWIILALVLILGWLLGLMTMTGGRKWKKAFESERAARVVADGEIVRLTTENERLAAERDQRIAVEKERDSLLARSAAANARIAELEKHSPAIGSRTAGTIAAAASGQRDDLARIYGIGRGGETRLNELGLHRYADVIEMSPNDEASLEGWLGLSPGTIADERWREQADMLRRGEFDEHARRFA